MCYVKLNRCGSIVQVQTYRSESVLNNHLLLLKRVVIAKQILLFYYGCPICLSNHKCAKSKRFETIEELLNHLRGKHPNEPSRKSVQTLAKNIKVAVDLGMLS